MEMEKFNMDFRKLYLDWLKENIDQYNINENTYRITLPFLDRNNDFTEFYVIKKDENKFILTDDGLTLSDLELSGFSISNSKRRKSILDAIVLSHGITLADDKQLYTECTIKDIAYKKHMLAQCMVKVSDMFYLNKSNVQSIFIDDVKDFFDTNNVRYVEDISIVGRSNYVTNYDFVIGKSNKYPERFVRVINNISSTQVKNLVFAWNDMREDRRMNSKLYAFIKNVKDKNSINALKEYNILPAIWDERTKFIDELVA